MEGHTVDPHQFLGIELNPRAAAIAELVLWIGYLQWHFRTKGAAPSEPILRAFRNIQNRDAVLTWDGYPMPKIVGGNEVYPNPRRPAWPAADFIVGNPPFIGGKDIGGRLGRGYTEALWAAHPAMNDSADLVMYWWDRAAELVDRQGHRSAPLRLRHDQLHQSGLPAPRRRTAPERQAPPVSCDGHPGPPVDQGDA